MTIAATTTTPTPYDAVGSPTSPSSSSLQRTSDKRALLGREHWRQELEALLRVYEPARAHCAAEVLDAYRGMERELVQCYRHYYTGEGGFRVSSGETFSLPREAIDTFLRLKLRARRSNSFASKGDGMRGVELASTSSVPSSVSAVRVPRPRAASTSAVRML